VRISAHPSQRLSDITMAIVVDCYNEFERAMGWYYRLQDKLQFPFKAKCSARRAISPLGIKDEVEVKSMAAESECEREMFVMIRSKGDDVGVPLSHLKPVAADKQTVQAVEDWHYWLKQGYQF
jgi:hypothetical protein